RRIEELERDRSRQVEILRFEHVAHAPAAKESDDVVMRDLFTDHRRGATAGYGSRFERALQHVYSAEPSITVRGRSVRRRRPLHFCGEAPRWLRTRIFVPH